MQIYVFSTDKKAQNLTYQFTNFNKPYQIFYQQYIKKSLCFNIHFYLEYYKSIVDFSNTKLLNIETEYIEELESIIANN